MIRAEQIRRASFVAAAIAGTCMGYLTVTYAVAGKTYTVTEKEKQFTPSDTLEIAVGDTVNFVNDDSVDHNVIIKKMDFDTGLQKPGASNQVTIDKAGRFNARCAIHPKMKLKIVAK